MTRRSAALPKRIASVILIAALAFAPAGCDTISSTSTSRGTPVVRKNVNNLTDAEKADFVAAIRKLKTTPAPDDPRVGNWYDHFVAEHMSKLMCWTDAANQGGYGHYGPDLLTWHRAFLREFEEAMTAVAGKPMALPYWDWTDPTSTAVVFADDFMGPPGAAAEDYVVTSGPFRRGEWAINVKGSTFTNPGQFDDLVRATATMPGMTALPPATEVREALSRPVYDTAPWDPSSDTNQSFRSYVDGAIGATGQACENGAIAAVGATSGRLHATVHMYVGGMNEQGQPGALNDTATSPNDPIFWLHHVNIDRIAEAWWSTHDYQYLPVSGGPRGDNINDVVWPFSDKTNGDMAKPVTQIGYTYDQLPSGRPSG